MAEEFDTPQSRNEAILQNMLGAENPLGLPQSRIEELLMQILEQGGGTEVIANPEMAGTEPDLTGLQVDETKYKVGGTNVVANPEMAGTESALTGLEVAGTKYAVGGGKTLYAHYISTSSTKFMVRTLIITDSATPFTVESLSAYLSANGFSDSNACLFTAGQCKDNDVIYNARGMYYTQGYLCIGYSDFSYNGNVTVPSNAYFLDTIVEL